MVGDLLDTCMLSSVPCYRCEAFVVPVAHTFTLRGRHRSGWAQHCPLWTLSLCVWAAALGPLWNICLLSTKQSFYSATCGHCVCSFGSHMPVLSKREQRRLLIWLWFGEMKQAHIREWGMRIFIMFESSHWHIPDAWPLCRWNERMHSCSGGSNLSDGLGPHQVLAEDRSLTGCFSAIAIMASLLCWTMDCSGGETV